MRTPDFSRLRSALPDRHDTTTLAGLVLLATGVGQISSAWSLIVTGAIVLALGIVGSIPRRRA
jgi:hypothetical protein